MDHLTMIPHIIQKLEKGRDSVHHIRDLLNQRPGSTSSNDHDHDHDHQGYFKGLDNHSMMALTALDSTLFMLHSISEHTSSEDPQFGNSNSQDSAVDTPRKDRRGCYKRRRNIESKIVETTELTDDGFAWRKYGQKTILNTTHPRNYFRCTHKIDQGCQATKQVQQISEKPLKYRIIYHGHHICKLYLHKTPPSASIVNYSSNNNNPGNPDSSVILSFETDTHTPLPNLYFSNSMVKQEETTSEPSDLHHHHQYNSSSSPSSPDPTTTTSRSEISSADVHSMASPHYFDMGEDYYSNIMQPESIYDLDQILQGVLYR